MGQGDEMDRASSTNEAEEECIEDIGGNSRRDRWEDQDIGGWTILKWILER
jgi:hypothetical protein